MATVVAMHKKGQAITREEKEQVIALAQTSSTRKEIAAKVGISDRSVARIWEKEGIRRDSQKPPICGKKGLIPRTSSTDIPLDPVEATRRKEHSDYLRGQTRYLAAHIRVPPPGDVLLWPRSTELSYAVNEITLGSGGDSPRRCVYVYLKTLEGQVQVSPDIERGEDWKFLWPHLTAEKDPEIARDYARWREGLAQFFTICHRVLVDVVSEADKRIDKKMEGTPGWRGVGMAPDWKCGVWRGFYEDIYSTVVGQREWRKDEFSTSEPEGQPGLVALRRSDRWLALGTSAEVDVYKGVYDSLRKDAADWRQRKELLETHEQLKDKGKVLLSKLDVIEKRGDFEGICEICRPWCAV
ncbi:MAG: transposase [Chloroflexi bacterium]|nr:transposase [Chloroflexota bacterium]